MRASRSYANETAGHCCYKMILENGDDDQWQDFKPLTAAQAGQWRQVHPVLSPWQVIRWQVAAGLALAVVLGLLTGQAGVAWSAGYGVLTVALPAAVFARGLQGRALPANAVSAAARLLLWEMVKIALTLALLAVAPRLVRGLIWPALLAGLVVALVMYWVALAVKPRSQTKSN